MKICRLKKQDCSLQDRRNRPSRLEAMAFQRGMVKNENGKCDFLQDQPIMTPKNKPHEKLESISIQLIFVFYRKSELISCLRIFSLCSHTQYFASYVVFLQVSQCETRCIIASYVKHFSKDSCDGSGLNTSENSKDSHP